MNFLAIIGATFLNFLAAAGRLAEFTARSISHCFRAPLYIGQIGRQMVDIGYYSLPVVGLTALFTGMVLALQSHSGFSRFDAESAIPTVVVLSITRELGPVMAGLMVAGRIGAAIAAELGTMRVTEQIDALETLSYDPVAYLVVPRVIAATLMLPLLVIFANAIGVATAGFTALTATDISWQQFSEGLRMSYTFFQIAYSLIKATIFGTAIAFLCSFEGYVTDVGAEGVGRSTAKAVVVTSVAILVLDALTASLLANQLQG